MESTTIVLLLVLALGIAHTCGADTQTSEVLPRSTPKSMLKQFEQELLKEPWDHVREGVEVKLCASPNGDNEVFILCRSRDRLEKEKAIFARFESRIEEGLKKIEVSCQKKKQFAVKIAERVGL